MNFDLNVSLPALTVFLQGLLSFFSPCVFPLVPLYVSYFAGGAKAVDGDGRVRYPRRRVLLHTVCFVLGLAAPGLGSEGDLESVTAFLEDNGYTFPVVMDTDGALTYAYGIRAYPTTFMISAGGSVYGYVEGALTAEWMNDIVEQTMEAG